MGFVEPHFIQEMTIQMPFELLIKDLQQLMSGKRVNRLLFAADEKITQLNERLHDISGFSFLFGNGRGPTIRVVIPVFVVIQTKLPD